MLLSRTPLPEVQQLQSIPAVIGRHTLGSAQETVWTSCMTDDKSSNL